jgi:hypothetical protein
MTLPTQENLDFIICEEIRQEYGNKLSLLGVFGGGIGIDTAKSSGSTNTYAIPSLSFYFNFRDGEGTFKADIKILDPDNEIILEDDAGELTKQPSASMCFYLSCRPFIFKKVGEYVAQLTLNETRYVGRFSVKHGSAP